MSMHADVYETEDLPEVEQHLREEETFETSEDVERIHIDMETALKHFKGRMINADHVDFSDSIARKRRTGYGSGAYVLEIVGANADEDETIEQKFHRLNYELIELAEAMKERKDKSSDGATATAAAATAASTINEEDLIAMMDTVRSVHLDKTTHGTSEGDVPRTGGSSTTSMVQVQTPSSTSSIMAANVAESRLVGLEARLKRLEQFVCGAGCDMVDDVTKRISRAPLAETMEDLRMRVQLLHPTHVDGLHSRINQVLAKMKQAEEKKSEKVDSDFEEKVATLYELMTKWDMTCVGLPSAVQRIHSLQKLHEQAQQFSTRLAHLLGCRAQLVKSIESEQMAMFDFRQQTADAIAKLADDMQKISARFEALKQ